MHVCERGRKKQCLPREAGARQQLGRVDRQEKECYSSWMALQPLPTTPSPLKARTRSIIESFGICSWEMVRLQETEMCLTVFLNSEQPICHSQKKAQC